MTRAHRWTADELATKLSTSKATVVLHKGGKFSVPGHKKNTGRLSKKSLEGVAEYLHQLRLAGLPEPVLEYRFCKARKWRADFAWPDAKLLVEYEGGVFTGGAHTRGKHFESDCEKYNTAALLGFRVLRFTFNLVRSGMALNQTESALSMR